MSLVTKLINKLGINQSENEPYWLKITTRVPKCTYFFGPFSNALEAKKHQSGYIEDLMDESAQGIRLEILQCDQPKQLTICDETKQADST